MAEKKIHEMAWSSSWYTSRRSKTKKKITLGLCIVFLQALFLLEEDEIYLLYILTLMHFDKKNCKMFDKRLNVVLCVEAKD